jgi:hypothetical protein
MKFESLQFLFYFKILQISIQSFACMQKKLCEKIETENKNFCLFFADFSFFAFFLEQFCIANFFIQYSKII